MAVSSRIERQIRVRVRVRVGPSDGMAVSSRIERVITFASSS